MGHKKGPHHGKRVAPAPEASPNSALELVLKADTLGTLDAVAAALDGIQEPEVEIRTIHREVGSVAKSDLDMAVTASRLVLGFGVGVNPKVDELARDQGVEVRLYDVIYDLTREVEEIARSLKPREPRETVTGQAKVIKLFKSTRKGIILGCEVLKGTIAVGQRFRVIAAMGPVYEGVVGSLHIEDRAVKRARVGEKAGLKIPDFKDGAVGDLVECFETVRAETHPWTARPGIHGPRPS